MEAGNPHSCLSQIKGGGQRFPSGQGDKDLGRIQQERGGGRTTAGLDPGEGRCRGSCRWALSLRHPEPLPAQVPKPTSDYAGCIREVSCSFLPPHPSSLSPWPLAASFCPHSLSLFLSYSLDKRQPGSP